MHALNAGGQKVSSARHETRPPVAQMSVQNKAKKRKVYEYMLRQVVPAASKRSTRARPWLGNENHRLPPIRS